MGSVWKSRRLGSVVFLLAVGVGLARAQDSPTDQLRHELEQMKGQLKKMQDQIERQERVIEKLTREKSQAAAPEHAAAPPAPAAPALPDEERIKREVTASIMQRVQPALAAANKTFPSQFNPAIGLVLDNVASYREKERANFEFRAAEIGISASVDPFARGYAIFTGSQTGVDVEEAAIVTTSLPYNLTVKGGRFFADFGRLSKFHDHDLPFVNRPIVLERYVDGESQADGVELSYLLPTSQYVTFTTGAYNKIGADNERVSNVVPRDLSQFTYLGRAATFFNLNDANSADLGVSYAYTPEVKVENGGSRTLAGIDLTYRYLPLSQAQYRGLIWGTEVLYNQEDRPVNGPVAASGQTTAGLESAVGLTPAEAVGQALDSTTPLVFQRRDATGLYSYVEGRLSRRLYPGFLFEWVQDLDRVGAPTLAYSPYLTLWASEFQRFRLEYTRLEAPGNHENEFFLQWTVILGSHVHGFRER